MKTQVLNAKANSSKPYFLLISTHQNFNDFGAGFAPIAKYYDTVGRLVAFDTIKPRFIKVIGNFIYHKYLC